ncbi:MAG: hypothetical protein GXP27_17475 [Planctomycetes bacterium]|nr:hypothetical protein [Planctomycetota bacterium]
MTGLASWGVIQLVYELSLMLLYPTLALLALSLLQMMWYLGEVVYDAFSARRRSALSAARQLRDIRVDCEERLISSLRAVAASRDQPPQVRRFVRVLRDELRQGSADTLEARVKHLVGQVEADLARDVNRVRSLVRLGPCLGLAGTLIPLGPGLMALSEGDLSGLSAQLVVAFSTTVLGLLVGGVSYVVAMVRAHTADLVASDIELVSELVCSGLSSESDQKRPGAPRTQTGGMPA